MGVPVPPVVLHQMRVKLYNAEPQYLSAWQMDPLHTPSAKLQREHMFAQACAHKQGNLARTYIALRDITKELARLELGR